MKSGHRVRPRVSLSGKSTRAGRISSLARLAFAAVIASFTLTGCLVGSWANGNPYIPGLTNPQFTYLGKGTLSLRGRPDVEGCFRVNNASQMVEDCGPYLPGDMGWAYLSPRVAYPMSDVTRFITEAEKARLGG
jgi:hypothetical protein